MLNEAGRHVAWLFVSYLYVCLNDSFCQWQRDDTVYANLDDLKSLNDVNYWFKTE